MKRIFISMAFLGAVLCANAQTNEMLRAQRQEFRNELTSKETMDREAKLDELYAKMDAIEETELNSVDGLANSCKGFLKTVSSTNDVLKEFKTEVKDNGEGEIDITKYKAKLPEYVNLSLNLVSATKDIAAASEDLPKATDDLKKEKNPRRLKPIKNSVAFSKDALPVCAEEVAFQTKLVNNLIETIKASDNY
ncbi:MAG: hypothetical protein IKW86_00815 [Salinivirgaceae bacterium]|nr:hypothetical protein [Salinivirgaceae bacterium]